MFSRTQKEPKLGWVLKLYNILCQVNSKVCTRVSPSKRNALERLVQNYCILNQWKTVRVVTSSRQWEKFYIEHCHSLKNISNLTPMRDKHKLAEYLYKTSQTKQNTRWNTGTGNLDLSVILSNTTRTYFSTIVWALFLLCPYYKASKFTI